MESIDHETKYEKEGFGLVGGLGHFNSKGMNESIIFKDFVMDAIIQQQNILTKGFV